MAFRIHDSVVRGEIDNRVKGIVRGKIWVEGRAEPVILELKGNAWPDLAGCLLTFTNPQERFPHPHLDSLDPVQRGSIGDLTASRKVRVFDVPLEKALEMIRRKEKPPEHMANCLYLEWFSEANGRVVERRVRSGHDECLRSDLGVGKAHADRGHTKAVGILSRPIVKDEVRFAMRGGHHFDLTPAETTEPGT